MKTSRIFTMLAGMSLLIFSCTKELSNEDNYSTGKSGQLTITAGLEDSKVALGDKVGNAYPLTWSEGDYIVLDGVKSNVLTASQAGTAGASFTFEGEFTAPYNVIYGGKVGTADVAVFPAVQNYTAGTFAPFSAPLYGTGSVVESIKMKSLNSVIRIPLSQGETVVSKILVEAQNGEILSGDFTLNKTAGAFDGTMTAPTEGKAYVTLDCGEGGVSLADGEVSFFVSIPAGSYAEGFKIYVVNSEKQAMILSAGSLKTAVAGKVYELPAKGFVAGNTYVIANADDMDILPTLIHDGTTDKGVGKEVILIDDIDMTGKTWTSFGSGANTVGSGNFTASLDGKGHTIKGLTQPLFGNFAGKLKNITVEANIDWTEFPASYKGSTYGLGIVAAYATNQSPYNNGTLIENVTTKGSLKMGTLEFDHNFQVGGVVGVCNSASVINCTNKATINISTPVKTPATLFSVGGVTGLVQYGSAEITETGECTFTDNANEGNIDCVLSNTDCAFSSCAVAGVVGIISKHKTGTKISNMSNSGKITVSGSSAKSGNHVVAGVCAFYAIANSAENWTNTGEVHSALNYSGAGSYVAGVLGRVGTATPTFTNFTNSGDVYIDEGFKFAYCGIGGVVALVKANSTFDGMINNGDITFIASSASQTTSWARVGGVMGHIEAVANVTLKNSINNGDVSFNNGNSSKGCVAGGMIGNIKATTFTGTDNVNTGNITYNGTNSNTLNLAGLYGRIENNGAAFTINITGVTGKATNSGIITLNDTNNNSKTPIAGGVIGYMAGASGKVGKLTMSDCSNAGELRRTVSNFVYIADNYKIQEAGGIIGSASSSVSGTITNCSNSATIQFSKNNGGATALYTSLQDQGYIGGIGGRLAGFTVKNCHNSGDVPSIEGYCGGIVGYCWSLKIIGEKGNYCTNTGNIAHREGVAGLYPQTAAGGIIGGGSTAVKLEWCYNTGAVAGNGGIGGLVGRINNIDAKMDVKHCKSFCKVNCVSTWAKAGLMFGNTALQEDAGTLLTNVKDIAVGGTYRYGGDYSTPTAENYVNHLYYNKVTAPAAAQEKGAATAVITVEEATNTYDITLWDGTSVISWEN